MAQNLTTSVITEIDRLQKEIKQRTSELASLKGELKRHQRVHQLLGGGDRRARTSRRVQGRPRRTAPVNWNSVLQGLRTRFTIGDLTKAGDAKGKSPAYLRQIRVRWARQAKTKRIERGKYQKIQQGKSRAKAGPQKKRFFSVLSSNTFAPKSGTDSMAMIYNDPVGEEKPENLPRCPENKKVIKHCS